MFGTNFTDLFGINAGLLNQATKFQEATNLLPPDQKDPEPAVDPLPPREPVVPHDPVVVNHLPGQYVDDMRLSRRRMDRGPIRARYRARERQQRQLHMSAARNLADSISDLHGSCNNLLGNGSAAKMPRARWFAALHY